MPKFYLIAIAAGFASGVLHLAQAFGTAGGLVLGFIATLPLFLAGLSLGATAALVAGAAGAVVGLLVGGLPVAALYFVSYALPVAVLCRQALLSRVLANGDTEWYPPGQLVLCLMGVASAFFVLIFVGLAIFADGLIPAVETLLHAFLASIPPEVVLPESFVADSAPMVPIVAVASWVLLMLMNGILAQGLLVRFERNCRPSPKLADITYPSWVLAIFAGSVLVSYFGGNPALFGKTLAVIGAVAYFLLGLGVLHGLFQRFSVGWPVKILFYCLILPLIWPVSLILVAAGIMRHVKQLRRPNDDGDNGGRKET